MTYGYDAAARLTSASDSNGVTYAQAPTFLASGAIQEFSSPNFNNNKFHADYNNRLQPTEIWAGPAAGASALFDKKYSYSNPNTPQMNNGNVYTVTNVKDDSRTQSFTYDSLNRLLGAGDKTHWSNTYVYDAWGNLYQKNPGPPAGENLVKTADTNNRLSGLSYDAAGNVTNDGTGNTFVYDAENRIISSTNGGITTTYTYGAGGQRIQKASGSTVTNYWMGVAETDSTGNTANYIFFAGERLARNIPQASPNPPDIKYYITDHLHSTAMFVDKAGTVLDDNDFYPWGGVVPGVGTTTSNNHYKFTGKERDTESQLDYFGARYYANITGRFMSPDWAGAPTTVPYAEFGDPQSLNLYSYVRNSPIVRVDADGHTNVIYDTPLGTERPGGTTWGDGAKCQVETCTETEETRSTTITYTNGTTQTIINPPQNQTETQPQTQTQTQQKQLSVGDVSKAIQSAKKDTGPNAKKAVDFLNSLGTDWQMSGDTLRQALKDSKVDAHGVDKNVDSISRTGDKVTVQLNKGINFLIYKTKTTISFKVGAVGGRPALVNIQGVEHFTWHYVPKTQYGPD